ncbi:hypothetical protein Ahy_A09g045522 isoform C [Arachis hypogaea]|uniref:Uncharacterized protein n=1 Tax=Arachis hypogaea TaxID=3818 RepID=A0A445BMJ3_ARAHY|nr:hypothetical protein Ahy_A09g045522 isoform C [Arachis hypogaea]
MFMFFKKKKEERKEEEGNDSARTYCHQPLAAAALSVLNTSQRRHVEGFEPEDDKLENASIDSTTLHSLFFQLLTTDFTPSTSIDPQPKLAPFDLSKLLLTTLDFWMRMNSKAFPSNTPSPITMLLTPILLSLSPIPTKSCGITYHLTILKYKLHEKTPAFPGISIRFDSINHNGNKDKLNRKGNNKVRYIFRFVSFRFVPTRRTLEFIIQRQPHTQTHCISFIHKPRPISSVYSQIRHSIHLALCFPTLPSLTTTLPPPQPLTRTPSAATSAAEDLHCSSIPLFITHDIQVGQIRM